MSFVRQKPGLALFMAFMLVVGGVAAWMGQHPSHYLAVDPKTFVAIFPPPPDKDSAATRAELDELLALQAARTPATVTAARDDREKDVSRFYGALGLPAHASLPKLNALMNRVEDDIAPYVRAAKRRFQRLRPYAIEPRIQPCIDDVRDDQSYPSGHAAYGWTVAYLLTDLAPARQAEIERRAAEFARQRMVCGVHFRSDVEAGRDGALWLARLIRANALYAHDAAEARAELQAALQGR